MGLGATAELWVADFRFRHAALDGQERCAFCLAAIPLPFFDRLCCRTAVQKGAAKRSCYRTCSSLTRSRDGLQQDNANGSEALPNLSQERSFNFYVISSFVCEMDTKKFQSCTENRTMKKSERKHKSKTIRMQNLVVARHRQCFSNLVGMGDFSEI